ncbi:MAG: methylaspartate ammonia-lyase [Nitrososphaeria archaeon]
MKIKHAMAVAGLGGFYYDDQTAIRKGAIQDGFIYLGKTITKGYKSIRQPGEVVSIILVMEDNSIAYGDCCAVTYSGVAGREPLFTAQKYVPIIRRNVLPKLKGLSLSSFKNDVQEFDTMMIGGRRLHAAIRYGVTQAILDAHACSSNLTKAEVIAKAYQLSVCKKEIPVLVQTGEERYMQADKAILKRADVLPHGCFNTLQSIGTRGKKLIRYAIWLKRRISEHAPSYLPTIHFDVYGTLGEAFAGDKDDIVKYLIRLEKCLQPYKVQIEYPVYTKTKEEQIQLTGELKDILSNNNSNIRLIVDEWCNTMQDIKDFVDAKATDIVHIKMPDLGGINNAIEAVTYCKKKGVFPYLGGSCNETDQSARVSVHVALATSPLQMLAKPGMGVDEGLMIVRNEMARVLEVLRLRGIGSNKQVIC